MKTTDIDVKPFKAAIKNLSYPVLIIAHGKYNDDYYLAADEPNLINSFRDIFETNGTMGYYDDIEFDEMTELQMAAFVYNRAKQGAEYEDVTIHQFVN
jgi:hypothetical protein